MSGPKNVKMPPEVKAVMREWLRRKIRGQSPDFTEELANGTPVEITRIDACCDGCAKVAQHYPYQKCIKDGLAKGLSKKDAAYRCRWIACCQSKRENKFKETGYCKDFDCDKEPKWGKTAKATGTKTGQGESVGLFIPLPKHLAKKFPSLGEEDSSPSHVTFLYIGDFPNEGDQQKLVDILKESCRRFWPLCEARLGELDYFDHEDKDRRVPHVKVEFDKDLAGFKHRIKQELQEAGVEVEDKFPEYKPHVTLAYMPGMDAEWKGKTPKGAWTFSEMEVWGLPKVHRLKLGPSIHKVSEQWLRNFVRQDRR